MWTAKKIYSAQDFKVRKVWWREGYIKGIIKGFLLQFYYHLKLQILQLDSVIHINSFKGVSNFIWNIQ